MSIEESVVFRERLRAVESDVSHIKDWQTKQNGTIQRVEQKIDRLIFWMMTAALGTLGSLIIGLILFFVNK